MNAVEIEQVITELVARPFDRAEFAYDFLEAVGNKPVTIKKLRVRRRTIRTSPSIAC
jgi:hypothetical protein